MKRPYKNGQALVEYILILTVLVFIVTGLMYKFIGKEGDGGVRDWANSIVGDNGYIACLLQTGTLPGKPHSDCPAISRITASFSSSTGSSSTGSSSSTDSSSSTGSSSSTDSSSSTGSSSTAEESGSGEGGSGKSPNSEDGEGVNSPHQSLSTDSSDSNNGGKNNTKRRGGRNRIHNPDGNLISVDDSESFSLEQENLEEGGGSSSSGRRGRKKKKKIGFNNLSNSDSNPGYSGRRLRAVSSYGYTDRDQEKAKKRNRHIAANNISSKKKSTFRGQEKTSRFIIKKKLKKSSQDVKIGKWSFGNIFRVVLIILVLAVLVFLIASQTTQVKKSMK